MALYHFGVGIERASFLSAKTISVELPSWFWLILKKKKKDYSALEVTHAIIKVWINARDYYAWLVLVTAE